MRGRRIVRLSRLQQVIVVLGVWVLAVVSSDGGIEAATYPLTLLGVLAAAVLIVLTTGS